MLVTAKRLWLRHLRQWLHNGLRRRQRRLYRARTARPRLATLVTLTASTEILRAHLYGAYDTLRARNNARLHAKCMHRLTRSSGDDAGCNARVNRDAAAAIPMLDPHRAIHDHGSAEHNE
jgi:hypothetical protein